MLIQPGQPSGNQRTDSKENQSSSSAYYGGQTTAAGKTIGGSFLSSNNAAAGVNQSGYKYMNMTNGAGGFGVTQTNPGTAGGNNAGNQKRRTVIEQLNQGLNPNQQRVNTQMEGNNPDQKGINQSLIKQKWSNNKNAFSGPLLKKSGEGGKASEGSNSKGNSQTRGAMEVYGAANVHTPGMMLASQNGSSMSNGSNSQQTQFMPNKY